MMFSNSKNTFNLTNVNRIIGPILFVICVCVLSIRVKYGIDLTDECWYVAEPYIVAKGATPFINNWSQTPGFSFPLFFIYKIFLYFNKSTEGILLFFRYLYVIWSSIIIVLIFFVLNKKYNNPIILIFILPLLFITPSSLYQINYNTIGIFYSILSIIIALFYETNNNKIDLVDCLIGVIMPRSILGTPLTIIAWLFVIIYFAKKKEKNRLISFLLGNTIITILFFIWCDYRENILNVFYGINFILKDFTYFKIERVVPIVSDIILIAKKVIPIVILFVCTYLGLHINIKKLNFISSKIIILLLIFGVYHAFNNSLDTACAYLFPIPFFSKILNKNKKEPLFSIIYFDLIFLLIYIFSSITNIYGISGRYYWLLIPSIFNILFLFLQENSENNKRIYLFTSIFLLISLIFQNNAYVYRDKELDLLIKKNESGIWKGCYSTKERINNVNKLEEYLKQKIYIDDRVLFLDWASFGYLIVDCDACTPTALDPMQYTYKTNYPQIMYDYFQVTNNIPTCIVYIDYGRDSKLSIDDEWYFNSFVNSYYYLADTYNTDETIENRHELLDIDKSSFLIKIYRLKNIEN